MKIYREVAVHLHEFLTSAVDEAKWSASRLALLYQWRDDPRYQLSKRKVGLRADMEAVKKKPII
jgi:hypothetical protein